jgi:hypothetical protein
MNPLPTLLWLEFKRTAWVIYAALLGLALFAFILLALPGVLTGLDVLNLPVAGTATGSEQECVPPDCPSSGRSNVQLSRESSAHGSSFSWSFSRSWGGNPDARDPDPPRDAATGTSAGQPSVVPVPIPEEFQVAFRPRQAVTVATGIGLTGLMLLGFWLGHSREADRGEMVMLYQSPVSGQTQLALRFFYMAGSAAIALLCVLAIYWMVQISQSLAPLAPMIEALGARVHLHWGSLILTLLCTWILPNTAFALLFIQMQNAYDLLGGKRLIGFVLVLTGLVSSAEAFFRTVFDPETSGAVLHVVSVVNNPSLDSALVASQYRFDVPLEVIVVSAGASVLMLILAARIWREVEWS